MVPLGGVPEPWELRTLNGLVRYLRIGPQLRRIAEAVSALGTLVIVEGDERAGLVDVRSIRVAPGPQPPPPLPPGGPPTASANVGTRHYLTGVVRRSLVSDPRVTHTLVEPLGQRWLLLASGASRAALDAILALGEDRLTRVAGVMVLPIQGQWTLSVYTAEAVDDDDVAMVVPGAALLDQAQLRAAIANLTRLLAQRGVVVTPAQALQLLIQLLPRQSFPL